MEEKLQKLKQFNLIMGALHLIQGIAMLFLATNVIQKIAEFQPTITQNFLKFKRIQDSSSLLIFFVNATMNLFGLVMEQLNSKRQNAKVNWGPFVWGSIAGIAPWIAILLYMFGTGNFGDVPWFVWAIVGVYFIAFNTFPINR